MSRPLMPKATAVWLVENTSLTFEQIADFCALHPLEVKRIADDEPGQHMRGVDPVSTGALTREEIARCEADPAQRLKIAKPRHIVPSEPPKKGPRYTPVSRRQDRPDAIYWLLRNHPELTDGEVSKLVGTTKATIVKIRDRTHWNIANLKPVDPVSLGLCTQLDLDLAVERAAKRRDREAAKLVKAAPGAPLKPVAETLSEPKDADEG